MQCNTNYTGNDEVNIKNLNLNVLDTFKKEFPELITGLSDHTISNLSVLASISKGARVIEKHFTDNINQEGPDHKFSLTPKKWSQMVQESRLLELSLGNGVKKIENNEKETVILQRRSICASRSLKIGETIKEEHLTYLRPCPKNAFNPYEKKQIIGLELKKNKKSFEPFLKSDF